MERLETGTADSVARGERCYGCLFCVTGQEEKAVQVIRKKIDLPIIAPVRLAYHLSNGIYSVRRKSVFPGYLFFSTEDDDIPVYQLESADGVVRLLRYDSDAWALRGDDATLAKELFKYDGVIGFSKGKLVNGKLKILDGFLKPYENKIIKIDKRHRVANVEIRINERPMNVWLGFELEGEEIRAGDSVDDVRYSEGDRVCVVDGIMKDCEGVVVRVDRRAKTADVRIDSQGKLMTIRLEFGLIDKL